jgi:Isopropylmalate/homocitrate/citramalate synthases
MDYLCRIVEAVIKAGATTVNIPDTVGYTDARGIYPLHAHADRAGAEFRQGGFSVHCHNDLGMAVRIRWPASPAARGRSNAPSTASASAPAMPRSKKS